MDTTVFVLSLTLFCLIIEGSESSTSGGVSSSEGNAAYWVSFGHSSGSEAFRVCKSGRRQSPIDIPLDGNIKAKYESFRFINYDAVPSKYILENNAHTAKLSPTEDSVSIPQIEGGGLGATFRFAQLHFHWGGKSTVGSEHTVGGRAYPLELHAVHFNTEYGSDLVGALTNGEGAFDTLAVLGVLFEVQPEDNPIMDPIIDNLVEVKMAKTKTNVKGFPLEMILPTDRQSYYRYGGSLTTPLCNEIVIWTVFRTPVGISEKQLEKFRSLTFGEDKQALINTYRSVQPINGRLIFDVSASPVGFAPLPALSLALLSVLVPLSLL